MTTEQKIPEFGSVTIKPTRSLDAGSRVTLTLTYTVGAKGIADGGGIAVGFPETWESPVAPQLYNVPWQPRIDDVPADMVRTYSPRNLAVEFETDGLATPRLLAAQHWARVIAAHGGLAQGDKITLVYGDTTWGSDGAFVGNTPRDDQTIRFFVDVSGSGEYSEVANSPVKINVISGAPTRIHVVAPSLVRMDEEFALRVAITDAQHNRPRSVMRGHLKGKPVIVVKKGRRGKSRTLFRQEMKETENNFKVFRTTRFSGEGVMKVAVSDESGDLFGLSNPVFVAAPPEEPKVEGAETEEAQAETKDAGPAVEAVDGDQPDAGDVPEQEKPWQIYWGDIHGKTEYTPGARRTTVDQYYVYGKEVALLDFCAITDEGAGFKEEAWAAAQDAARKHHVPGEFITLKAFEWASSLYGHRSVYFTGDRTEPKLDDKGNLDWLDIRDFYALFKDRDVLIVPQNTFVWTNWDFHDPVHECLVEVYSSWGACEKHGNPLWTHSEIPGGGVQAALARGYRMGIIASSDTQFGMPGKSYPEHWDVKPFKGGLAAVYAKELTREAIFDAFKRRQCYGTTGARIIVEFFVNDQPMGSEVEVPFQDNETPRVLKVKVIGSEDIAEVVIVRNNTDIYRATDCGQWVEFDYEDDEPMREALAEAEGDDVGAGSIYYYLRVLQKDGEMAWCSPVWTTLGGPPEPGKIQKQE
ncbi:MAG: DUF3604 domain-containing protein [Planctomycetes bacterium]|nr:DUF3604 domain-containing protein [Planctomycetota bacterium]